MNCLNGDKTPVHFSETELPPVKVLKSQSFIINPENVDVYKAQW